MQQGRRGVRFAELIVNAHRVTVGIAKGVRSDVAEVASPPHTIETRATVFGRSDAFRSAIRKGAVISLCGDVPARARPVDKRRTRPRHKVARIDAR